MGGQRPDTDFCNFLEITYSEKRDYGEKIGDSGFYAG